MLLLLMMSLILAVAGTVHLIQPELFLPAMPPYLPFPIPLIYFTGLLELFAAAGILAPRLRRLTGLCLVAYFIAILPAHFHIASNSISMFGITDPRVLWGRLVFQGVFIYWAYWIANFDRIK